jgi:uncharacterized protein (TIGR02145 family)
MRTKHLFFILGFLLFFASTCNKPEKEYQLPKIYTRYPLEITTSKTLFRAVFTKGSKNIRVFGFEWKKTTDSIFQKVTVPADKNNFTFSYMANHLEEDTEYIVKAFISDVSDTVLYGKEVCFFTKGTVTDIDGNIYLTMRYGDKVWMTENLRVTHFADGTPIEARSGGKDENSDGPVYYYDNYHTSQLSNPNFGLLYNWAAAAKVINCDSMINKISFFPHQGICPDGWHLPLNEWGQLINLYGGSEVAANVMKTPNWSDPPSSIQNFSQFSVEPAGSYHLDTHGDFSGFYESALFRLRVPGQTFMMVYGSSKFQMVPILPSAGCSVRCVKD